MLEQLIFVLLGCSCGVLVGLLPGLTNSIAMVLLYPFLMHFSGVDIVSFYVSMITLTQYHGGLGATIFGIPTEVTCLPSVKEGFTATLHGKSDRALSVAALSSFSGSVIAVALSFIIFYIGNHYFALYNYSLQLIMLSLVLTVVVLSTNNNKFISIALLGIGYILGKVGADNLTNTQFLTFNNPYLQCGIPLVPVLVFLYSFPMILNLQLPTALPKLRNMVFCWVYPASTIIRSSVIGFVCGFIPQLGNAVASNLSYSVEKLINKKTYESDGDIKSLAASDSAHNAAIVSTLIPLFCFAVPIIPSEAILYEISRSRGIAFSMNWLLNNWTWLAVIFTIANIVGVLTTWPMAKYIVNFISARMKYFKIIILIGLFFITLQMAIVENSLGYYSALCLVFAPVGYALRRYDVTPLLIGFVLSEQFDNVIRVVYQLYIGVKI